MAVRRSMHLGSGPRSVDLPDIVGSRFIRRPCNDFFKLTYGPEIPVVNELLPRTHLSSG